MVCRQQRRRKNLTSTLEPPLAVENQRHQASRVVGKGVDPTVVKGQDTALNLGLGRVSHRARRRNASGHHG